MASGTDRDAAAFLEAATIYDSRQQRGIFELVRLLKQYGLWSKMKAIYPFVGGTATTHKWNLKDPQDTDAAFRLTFSGGWTHSSTGADPNGTNAYADTFLSPASHLTNNDTHISYYSREDVTEAGGEIGMNVAATNLRIGLFISFTGSGLVDRTLSDQYQTGIFRISAADADSRGFYIGTRTSSTSHKLYKNGSQLGTTNTSTSTINFSTLTPNVFIGARSNSGTANQFSTKECAFATVGSGLTDTDSKNLHIAVLRYQQILGRAV